MRPRRQPAAERDEGRSFSDLGPLQRDIVATVWMMEEASVKDVRGHLAAEGRDLAYTTVLSALQKLEKAGWLAHRPSGRTYLYRVLRSRAGERRRSLQRLLRQLFGGDRTLLLQQLLAERHVSPEEAKALARLVRDHSRSKSNG